MSKNLIIMSKVRKIIELYHNKEGKKTISKRLNIPLSTVRRYTHLFLASNKSFKDIESMSDTDLENMFIRMGNRSKLEDNLKYQKLLEFFPKMERELKKVGMTKEKQWERYLEKIPGGYRRSQFNWHYQRWHKSRYPIAIIEHKAGDKMYVDYTGKKLQILDPDSGQPIYLEVFVAILGASQLIYAEASMTQSTRDFIVSNVNALEYFGGSPKAVVTDNLKAAVIKSSKYEPKLNEAYKDFAGHYMMAVLPAAPYRPTYKSLVEGAVRIIYREIYVELQLNVYSSIESINAAILLFLERLNNRNFSRRKYSRRQLYNDIESVALDPLPKKRYELRDRCNATVLKNNHVRLVHDQHYYSVPYQFIGRKISIYYNDRDVEIYYRYERIAIHKRDRTAHRYSTLDEHLLARNRDVNNWDIDKYLEKAKVVGDHCYEYFQEIVKRRAHSEAAFKSCRGIINLLKGFSPERLNKACKRAAGYNDYSFSTIEAILSRGLDKQDQEDETGKSDMPKHDNVRGKDYYK
ncbi:MAG: IS21 family transposase [Candidatus Peribacteraceae bacterium]|nr:IS21 family transposase [Candidatus Peribacteraceae bacterium]